MSPKFATCNISFKHVRYKKSTLEDVFLELCTREHSVIEVGGKCVPYITTRVTSSTLP